MEEKLKDITDQIEKYDIFNKDSLSANIPPYSKITIDFFTFCMDVGKVAPAIDEPYIFSYEMLDMPLYFKIMQFFNKHPEIDKDFRQNLIWKLCKRPKFNELSEEEQNFLFQIDEYADAEVNNYKVKNYRIWSGYPKEEWPEEINPQTIPGTELKAKLIHINGFSEAKVDFYNYTDKTQKLILLKSNPGNLSANPYNKTRQRLGFLGSNKFNTRGLTPIAGVRG